MTMDEITIDRDIIEYPMDGWIRLALYSDSANILKLCVIVQSAVDRLLWEIKNTPARWVNVRKQKESDLEYWVGLLDKLRSLSETLDPITF